MKAGYGKAGKQTTLSNFSTATTTTNYNYLWDTDSEGKVINSIELSAVLVLDSAQGGSISSLIVLKKKDANSILKASALE